MNKQDLIGDNKKKTISTQYKTLQSCYIIVVHNMKKFRNILSNMLKHIRMEKSLKSIIPNLYGQMNLACLKCQSKSIPSVTHLLGSKRSNKTCDSDSGAVDIMHHISGQRLQKLCVFSAELVLCIASLPHNFLSFTLRYFRVTEVIWVRCRIRPQGPIFFIGHDWVCDIYQMLKIEFN